MSPLDVATAASAQRIREEHMPAFRRTGRLDQVSVEFVSKSGEIVSMLATTIAEEDADGRYLHSLSVYNELSDHDRLHSRYRDRYQSTPAMLHTIDEHGRIKSVSDHWLDKMGYAREEVIGRSIGDFVTEESRERMPEGRLTTADEAPARARELGFPVALKAVSIALPHKTEAGAVKLGLLPLA